MNKAVFMNLSIDQLFDPAGNLQKIFSVRIPQSEHLTRVSEDLAVFLTGLDDLAIQYKEIPAALHEVFLGQGFQSGKVISITANPFDGTPWSDEVRQKTTGMKIDHWQVAGLSAVESALVGKNYSQLTVKDYAQLNKKTWLVELAKNNAWNFPISEIVKTNVLVSKMNQHFDQNKHLVLKPSWSSGGGGNLYIEKVEDPICRHLFSRLDQIQPEFQWIIQQRIPRSHDWSITASTDSDEIKVYEVFYDKSGLSYRHQRVLEQALVDFYETISKVLRLELKSKGYFGVFGFDSFSDPKGEIFPITDLNVRWTKTHLIEAAIAKLNLSKAVESYRFRFHREKVVNFDEGFKRMSNLISTNPDQLFFPYLLSGLCSDQPGQTEISFFTNSDLHWHNEVLLKIKQIWGG